MALLEGPPVIAEDLLEGVLVDPLSVMCHGRWLYHTLPLGSTCLPSLPCAPPWSLERGTQGQHKKEILIRSSYEATEKWFAVVFLALAFLQWRLHHAPSKARWRSLADVVRQHRYEHARTLLETACQEAVKLTDYLPVLQRFLC